MKRNTIVVLLVAVSLLFSAIVLAESLKWTAPTEYTDGTTIESGVLDVMRFYLRTDEPNGGSATPDSTGKYYFGTAPARTSAWPANNDLAGFFHNRGLQDNILTFTVSSAYVGTDGAEHEGAPSPGYAWTVPFVPGKTPGQTIGVTVE